jgi:modulator of FtsH protease
VTAYDPSAWSDLFVASAGAAAALSGLVFVAVSINIERILDNEGVPDFAFVTVLLLLGVLMVSLLGLIPDQGGEALGWELLGGGLAWAALIVSRMRASIPSTEGRPRYLASRVVLPVVGMAPLLIGAITLVASAGGGLHWIVAGIITTIFAGVANAWILLVEILR